jgi:hypothetical protein
MTKNGLGNILGDFFTFWAIFLTSASGHPDTEYVPNFCADAVEKLLKWMWLTWFGFVSFWSRVFFVRACESNTRRKKFVSLLFSKFFWITQGDSIADSWRLRTMCWHLECKQTKLRMKPLFERNSRYLTRGVNVIVISFSDFRKISANKIGVFLKKTFFWLKT